jgi:hypothetical protein
VQFKEKRILLNEFALIITGYHEAADVLHREAGLPRCVTPPPAHPSNLQVFPPAHAGSPCLFSPSNPGISAPRALVSQLLYVFTIMVFVCLLLMHFPILFK